MELNQQQQKLFEYVKLKHGEQKRKYTGKPYYNHLLNVARIIDEFENDCIEVALCHDLFEDTDSTFNDLHRCMVDLGYSRHISYLTCTWVIELTDRFTNEDYPYLNRVKRKENECKRLSKISYKSQSVKYADLIDNTSSIVQYDKSFASVYLREKEAILTVMDKGNKKLYNICCNTLEDAKTDLASSTIL